MDQGQYENNVSTQYNSNMSQPQYSESTGQSQYNNTNQYNDGQLTKNTWMKAILIWVLATQLIITVSRIAFLWNFIDVAIHWTGYSILLKVLFYISIFGCAVIILNVILDIVCMVCSMRQSKKNNDGKYGGNIFAFAVLEMIYGLSSLFAGTSFWVLMVALMALGGA